MKEENIISTNYFINEYRNQFKEMEDDDRKTLLELAKKDKNTFNYVWSCNLPLTIKAAATFNKQYSENPNIELDDLIQEAALGLKRAIELYDPANGTTFATYAFVWMKQRMIRYIDQQTEIVRKPVHFKAKQMVYFRTYRELRDKYLDKDKAEINNLVYEKLKADKVVKSLSEYVFLLDWCFNVNLVSLDQYVMTDSSKYEETTIGDFVVDESIDVEKEVLDQVMSESLLRILDYRLTAKEREVIERRFGFTEKGIETLEEIGNDFGVSRERIRQIEAKAIHKLSLTLKKEYLDLIEY